MKRMRLQYPNSPKGFTLVEILVVAALIALFSGLAMFSMSYLSIQSKRKAASADARTISDALTVVQMRHNTIPKFCYLNMTQNELQALSLPDAPLPESFDFFGRQLGLARETKILKSWEGPFLPSYAGRTVTGKSGVVKMRMPEQDPGTPTRDLFDWPADYWGNPYVLYVIQEDPQKPPRISCVVSYGPNGIPGGGDPLKTSLQAGVDFTPEEVEQIKELGRFYRLFRQERDHFVALKPEEIENDTGGPGGAAINHLVALNSTMVVGGTARGYMEGTNFEKRVPGILDSGSDDLVVHVH